MVPVIPDRGSAQPEALNFCATKSMADHVDPNLRMISPIRNLPSRTACMEAQSMRRLSTGLSTRRKGSVKIPMLPRYLIHRFHAKWHLACVPTSTPAAWDKSALRRSARILALPEAEIW